ncbi:5-(carboxyamino)imidazole ribonucleotide synthase [Candidatus Peregrinibacteria bacterium]|nr:MAG: 5-(carboxyamino)imidazole ribonucleotide synthase [Candidatus Peregrinibacteria bacterium]
MLIQSGMDWGISFHVLDNNPSAPCAHLANVFTCGDPLDFETVLNFGRTCDAVTLEFEHVNVDALEQLVAEGIPVSPSPSILRMVQDKGFQKEFYRKNGIPTAEFFLTESRNDVQNYVDFLPAFHKKRRSGYDGQGVRKIASATNIQEAFDEPSVLEKFIPAEKEISVLVARSTNGEMAHFPVVELDFHPTKHLVEFLHAPANLSEKVETEAISIARELTEKLGMVGILAVEMFVTLEGKILVNEIAPRPHNSGHHTIEGNNTSQFEQHLRAVLGLPLGSTETKYPAVMMNLLGAEGESGLAYLEGISEVLAEKNVFLHWYGKAETRPFRKMGHITILGETQKEAMEKAQILQKNLRVIARSKENR